MSVFNKPSGAPGCWGQKFQDGDPECMQCPHKGTCRPEMLNRIVATPLPPQMVPMPTRPYSLPTIPTAPSYQTQQYKQAVPPVPTNIPPVPQTPPSQWPNPQFSPPMTKPGVGSVYYFNQFPQESTLERLGKNILMKILQAALLELWHFFTHWSWPSDNRGALG